MRKKYRIKAKLAGVLATVLVMSMSVSSIPAYAVNHGELSVVEFDPQLGPDLSNSSYRNVPRRDNGVSFATGGGAGFPLADATDFNGVPVESFGSGNRPKLPEFNVTWDGYTFDGWYNKDGNKVTSLPYAFPYSRTSLYKAVWKGNAISPFNFTVMHYRDLKPDRDSNNDGKDAAAWPSDSSTELWKFFESGDWTKSVMANTPISSTYRRDIPGYRMKSVLIKNNKIRKYGEGSGNGTLDGGASINDKTKVVRGNMPNDHLTVAYRYEPDPDKKFTVKVEYVDAAGSTIKVPDTFTFPAEAPIDIAPAEINSYTLNESRVDGGVDDLAGRGMYSAATAGCDFDSDKRYKGKMPNQPVTITYTYNMDPDFSTMLQVKRLDNHGNPLEDDEIRQISPVNPVVIDVERKRGYVYAPNISWDNNFTGNTNSFNPDTGQLTLRSGIQGGTVTLVYNEDLSDESYWSKIEYYNGINGTFAGDPSPRFKKHGSYTIEELTVDLEPEPTENYVFDGWYRANVTGSDKEGEKLEGDVEVLQGLKLYANFEEDPNGWFDLTFGAGAHGRITGMTSIHTEKGTPWTSLVLPSPIPDAHYAFAGWFDESGNRVQDTQTILASQHYTARFVPLGVADDGILAMPDVRGVITSDGIGGIQVSGANEDRRYALTDMGKKILEVKTGLQLKSNEFTGLWPCTNYYVYELSMAANPAVGAILPDSVDAGDFGPPTRVNVPAVGTNFVIREDAEEGKMQLAINAGSDDISYALLNMDGGVVKVSGADESGWVKPSGSPLISLFTKLNPNQVYVVVAKHDGEVSQPEDKWVLGTQVAVVDASQTERNYTIKLTGGGYIDEVIRDGKPVEVGSDPTMAAVRKGDTVKIKTDAQNGGGEIFKQWDALIGSPNIFATRRNQSVTMLDENVVLQAVYQAAPTSGSGNASVSYTPKDGKTSLELSEDELRVLVQELTDNAGDREALGANIDVEYTVKFNRRPSIASEVNAVLDEIGGDDSVKVPWVLTSDLKRKVGGTNKELVAGGNYTPDIGVYSVIDRSQLDYLDYKLWKMERSGDTIACTQIPMRPDPNNGESGFTGVISFDASVGSTYALSYLKAHEVKIIDDKRATVSRIKVKSGTGLEDADGFADLDIFGDVEDPVTGIVYRYQGLGTSVSASDEYDITLPVTKPLTLHVLYQAEDDSIWQQARQKLMEQIAIAQALMNHTSVNDEGKLLLGNAIDVALSVANQVYRPSVEELVQAEKTLKAVMEAVSSVGPSEPDGPDEPSEPDGPDEPSVPDIPETPIPPSGGGGGDGNSGIRIVASNREFTFNNYKTYASGESGRWERVGNGSHSWAFVLEEGKWLTDQWVNIKYEDKRNVYTYHFNADGLMDQGWYQDDGGEWYLLDPSEGPDYGRLILGWYFDPNKQERYYLNQFTGSMLMGWQKLDDEWYYLNPVEQTDRPLGSLYVNEVTPDGYYVDGNGRWIREVP